MKGKDRIKVEAMLSEAPEGLSRAEITEGANLSRERAVSLINALMQAGTIYNVYSGQTRGAIYMMARITPPQIRVQSERHIPTGYYCGKELTAPPAREAGLHAYTIGSLTAGKVTPRSRPISLSSPVTV